MFYKKTDIEILCDALIKLSDKQERFMEKFGATIKSPYQEAMHSIMLQIETHFNLASSPTRTASPTVSTILNNADTSAKEKIQKKKQAIATPPRRYFKQPSPLTMGIGHSYNPGVASDLGNLVPKKAVEWAKDVETPVQPVNPPQEPVVMETVEETPEETAKALLSEKQVTIDNIDSLAENLMDKFETREANIPRPSSMLN